MELTLQNSTGTPVVAAGGIVTYAAPLSSYGNCIIVTHSVNGQIYTTVYAHLSSIQVSTGQSVGKGQQIGLMGSEL
ncbi:M23 family metallopeptidase [Ureibacillus acetophenoni]